MEETSEAIQNLTLEQITRLAEYFHDRDCQASYTDQCAWVYENSPNYRGAKHSHEHWASRVPELIIADVHELDEINSLIGIPPDQELIVNVMRRIMNTQFVDTRTYFDEWANSNIGFTLDATWCVLPEERAALERLIEKET